MKLKQVKIQNFRGIDTLKIDIYDFTSLIGPNNCGKSTILRAIQIFLEQEKPVVEDWRVENTDAPIIIEGVLDDIQDWERMTPGIAGIVQNEQIKLRVKIESPTDKPVYEAFLALEDIDGWDNGWTKIKAGPLKTKLDSFGISSATEWKPVAKKEEFKQYLRENFPDLISTADADWTSDNISISPALKQALPRVTLIPAISDASEATKPQAKTVFGQLLNAIVLPAIQSTDEFTALKTAVNNLSNKIKGSGDVEQPLEVQQLAENISTRIADIINVKAVLDISDPDTDKLLSSNAILKLNDGTETPISHQGHGAQRSLVFALMETIAKNNTHVEDEGAKTQANLLLFEEPELFLHPHLMRRLKKSLKTISRTIAWQVIISTHSPFLIDIVDEPRSLVILRKNESTNTPTNCQLTEDPFDVDSRESLRAAIDFHPTVTEAFFADRVVLVEGDTEIAIFKHTDEVYKKFGVSDESFNSTTFVSCGGKWTISAIARLLKAFNTPFRIIHDTDAKGRSQEELENCHNVDPFRANSHIRIAAGDNTQIFLVDDTFEDVLWPRDDQTISVSSKDKPLKSWKEIKRISEEESDLEMNYAKLYEIFQFAFVWD